MSAKPEGSQEQGKVPGEEEIAYLFDLLTLANEEEVYRIIFSDIAEIGEPAVPYLSKISSGSDEIMKNYADILLSAISSRSLNRQVRDSMTTNSSSAVVSDSTTGPAHRSSVTQVDTNHSTAKDEQILAWFKEVDLKEYLTQLQVYWCVGRLEGESMKSGGRSPGRATMAGRLAKVDPVFKFKPLPRGVTYLGDLFRDIDGLFDKEPFHSNAWSDEEQKLELRPEFMNGGRQEATWTKKAWTAWRYVDRFLTLRDLLPTITDEGP